MEAAFRATWLRVRRRGSRPGCTPPAHGSAWFEAFAERRLLWARRAGRWVLAAWSKVMDLERFDIA